MKTSAILIILIILNTTALISEPVSQFIKNINPWLFVGLEIFLLVGYFINRLLKELEELPKLDFNNVKLFVVKGNKKV